MLFETQVAEKMEALLAEKVISLTKAGNLEAAKRARAYQRTLWLG